MYCWAYCLPYSWRRSGLHQENKAGKMSTSKRKMNRKRWKQAKIIGKRSDDRLGLTATLAMAIGITGSLCFLFCWKGKSTITSRSRITHRIYFAANGRLGFNLTVKKAYTECTWQTKNTPTCKLNTPCAWQSINSQSHKPINSQAHKLRHATTHKRSCLWTYKLTNTSTHTLFNPKELTLMNL